MDCSFKWFAALGLFLAVGFPVAVDAQMETRTWTSRDGQDAIEASFANYDPKKKQVSLQIGSGDTIQVQLHHLSRADRRFVIQVARKNRVADIADQPDEDQLPSNKKSRRAKKNNRGATKSLFGINWTTGIEKALASATGSKSNSDDRPVMWMRVLGDLEGFM